MGESRSLIANEALLFNQHTIYLYCCELKTISKESIVPNKSNNATLLPMS